MKKLIITSAIVLVAVSSQAGNVFWNATDGVGNYTNGANWNTGVVPQTTDLYAYVTGNNTVWPTLDSGAPNVEILGVGYDSGGGDGVMNVVDGGRISPRDVYIGVRSTGVLNMSGGIVTAARKLGIGWGDGVGTINLSSNAVFFSLTEVLSWSPGSVVNVSDDAIFLVTGNHTNEDWITTGKIVDPDGYGIVANYSTENGGRTFFESVGSAVQVTDLEISSAADEVVLSWTALADKTYGVETNIDLTVPGNWGSWQTGLETPGGGALIVTNAVVVDETFYRIISE